MYQTVITLNYVYNLVGCREGDIYNRQKLRVECESVLSDIE